MGGVQLRRGGNCVSSAEAARIYGFTDADGRKPDFGEALKRYRAGAAPAIQAE